MKKILVPVDFSKYSEYALQIAASIAKQQNAEILVLHMLGLSEALITKEDFRDQPEAIYYMKLAKKRFEEFLNQPYLKGIKVSEMIQNYKIFSEINNAAIENDVDLIVMGSHGSGGLTEVFVGSNTEKVVRTSDIPVLVIKEELKDFNIKEVVFAFDFKLENIHSYRKIMKFFKSFDANVHLVYIVTPGERFKSSKQLAEKAEKFLKQADSDNLENLEKVSYECDYTIEDGIYNYSQKINADIIAIPTHGRQGLSHFFNGSISEDLANHVNKPVITFKI